jgi:adenylate kinase family enzyme
LNKKNEKAKIIQEAKKKYTYVRDDIVIDLIKPYIQNCEKDGKDWILEGFPRTVQQVVSL